MSDKGRPTGPRVGGGVWGVFTAFLVLRIAGEIDWSWRWVTSPLWLSWGAVIILVGLAEVLKKVTEVKPR